MLWNGHRKLTIIVTEGSFYLYAKEQNVRPATREVAFTSIQKGKMSARATSRPAGRPSRFNYFPQYIAYY